MAVMIPDIDATTISNLGEQAFYYAACHLPDSYTVMYSYRYKDQDATGLEAQIMEADFVIVNPNMGYLVIEVKQGDVNFNNGVWRELKGNDYDGDTKSNSVKFCTIRSFKGLEADIVFLIGIRNESKACTLSDVYVGGSRARFLLYVFHEESWNSAEAGVSC